MGMNGGQITQIGECEVGEGMNFATFVRWSSDFSVHSWVYFFHIANQILKKCTHHCGHSRREKGLYAREASYEAILLKSNVKLKALSMPGN